MNLLLAASWALLLSLPTAQADDDTSWYVVPNVAYDTDDGLGFGVRGELARLDGEHTPYREAWVLHAFASLRGYHHHRLRYDRLGLGADGRLRFTAHLAWRQWANDGYWGIGNGTVRQEGFGDDLDADDPDRKHYRYTLYQPFAHLALRQQVGQQLYAYVALNPKLSVVAPYPDSLLETQAPYGSAGGFVPQLLLGIQRDARDRELAPTAGSLLELGGRLAPWGTDEAGGFSGVFASARGFRSLGTTRLVLAGRLMAEALWGPVPFYEMVHWGGLTPVQGFGGFETLRGVPFGRWRAPGKAVANLELRARVVQGTVGSTQLGLELAPFSDVGAVFLAPASGPAGPLHPAAGVGARLIMDETFVGRVDVGWASDPIETDTGVVSETSLGIYVVFDHPF